MIRQCGKLRACLICGICIGLICSLVLVFAWGNIANRILDNQLKLNNNSISYVNWVETPIPMYLEINLFNWTNANEYLTEKPHFEEFGPYVFLEKHKRVNMTWNDNDTISFYQIRTWHFVPERSNGNLDDVITNLNVMSASVAYAIRNQNTLVKIFADYMLRHRGGSLFITKTVRELLFDGYEDQLLDFLRQFEPKAFNIPFTKFGWFAERNNSDSYDGLYTMFTGADNILNLGKLDRWKGVNHTTFRDDCGRIKGTTGELWPPHMGQSENISFYVSDVCRSLTLNYAENIELYGLVGRKYVGDSTVFDNGAQYPPNLCYCTSSPSACPDVLTGVQNISDCRYGAPAFISFPHFYLAHPSYVAAVDGLKPNKDLHEFHISIEPQTGIPLSVRAAMQINILLQPIPDVKFYQNVPNVMVPMVWFHQTTELTEDLAAQTKVATELANYGVYSGYGLMGFTCILALIIIIIFIVKRRNERLHFNGDDDDDLDTNETNETESTTRPFRTGVGGGGVGVAADGGD